MISLRQLQIKIRNARQGQVPESFGARIAAGVSLGLSGKPDAESRAFLLFLYWCDVHDVLLASEPAVPCKPMKGNKLKNTYAIHFYGLLSQILNREFSHDCPMDRDLFQQMYNLFYWYCSSQKQILLMRIIWALTSTPKPIIQIGHGKN